MNYETEARNFVIEVESEAARLIALGVPPWDAIIQARQRISARRKGKVEAAAAVSLEEETR